MRVEGESLNESACVQVVRYKQLPVACICLFHLQYKFVFRECMLTWTIVKFIFVFKVTLSEYTPPAKMYIPPRTDNNETNLTDF